MSAAARFSIMALLAATLGGCITIKGNVPVVPARNDTRAEGVRYTPVMVQARLRISDGRLPASAEAVRFRKEILRGVVEDELGAAFPLRLQQVKHRPAGVPGMYTIAIDYSIGQDSVAWGALLLGLSIFILPAPFSDLTFNMDAAVIGPGGQELGRFKYAESARLYVGLLALPFVWTFPTDWKSAFDRKAIAALAREIRSKGLIPLEHEPIPAAHNDGRASGRDRRLPASVYRGLITEAANTLLRSYRGAEDLPLAILPANIPDKKDTAVGELAHKVLTETVFRDRRFRIIDRENLIPVLRELAFHRSGLVDPRTAAKVGRLVGARAILVTRIRGGLLECRIVDVTSGELLAFSGANLR